MTTDITANIAKLKDIIEPIKICMFTTIDNEQKINSRPMTTIKIAEDGDIWFFTNDYSVTIQEVSKDNTVDLIYSHPGLNSYAHIKGSSSVVLRKEKIRELWDPMLKAWFPLGIHDPKLCLIKVSLKEASYWNASSNKMVNFFNILKAIATKEVYHDGEHGKIKVK
jgi:general stress protein 26